MRVPFDQVFHQDEEGHLYPRVPVLLHGLRLGPQRTVPDHLSLAGVPLEELAGRDLSVDIADGTYHVYASEQGAL